FAATRSVAQNQSARRRRESANRLCASDRQTRLRCEAAARQTRNAADGELSRKTPGPRQRDRRFTRSGRAKSVERSFEVSIAGDVSGKTENARRGFGGAAMSFRQFHVQWRRFGAALVIVAASAAVPFAHAANPASPPAPNPAQQQVSRDFQKTLSLGAGGSFSIENKFGEVRVHGESSREVKISATIRVQAGSREEADAYAQKVEIAVLQTGNAIFVRTVYPEEERRLLHGRNTSYSVNYDIAIPSDAPLTVKNSFGSVTATGVRGRADIDNSHGSLTVRETGSSRLNNSFGSIELHDANGDSFV